MVKIVWTEQALNDLVNIAEFIRRDSEKYARITVRKLRERVWQLKLFPYSGRELTELDNKETREIILGNYRIIYKIISSQQIDVLTIHHSARQLKLE
jgi:addiction module RelE/StbE family toxin